MYAIIEDSGTQIWVKPGDEIKIDVRELPEGASDVVFDRVMFIGDEEGGEPRIGKPFVDGARVTAELVSQGRDKKVDIYKIKRRKNYRRHNGHRQSYMLVKINAIEA